jgi:hypothetical protein
VLKRAHGQLQGDDELPKESGEKLCPLCTLVHKLPKSGKRELELPQSMPLQERVQLWRMATRGLGLASKLRGKRDCMPPLKKHLKTYFPHSKRARDERALAAERRMQALRSIFSNHFCVWSFINFDFKAQPNASTSVAPTFASDEEFSDDEVEFVAETDTERRQALLSSEQDDDLRQKLGSESSWTQFENDFNFNAPRTLLRGRKRCSMTLLIFPRMTAMTANHAPFLLLLAQPLL